MRVARWIYILYTTWTIDIDKNIILYLYERYKWINSAIFDYLWCLLIVSLVTAFITIKHCYYIFFNKHVWTGGYHNNDKWRKKNHTHIMLSKYYICWTKESLFARFVHSQIYRRNKWMVVCVTDSDSIFYV
jgi:fucose 4-O-acetylase-like acetyltransferase